MSWGVDSGLGSDPNCDFSTPSSGRSAPFRATRLKHLNPTVTKPNGHVSVGYPTVTSRYVEVELDVGRQLVVAGGAAVGVAVGVTSGCYELEPATWQHATQTESHA